jgi:hypothetical protein
VGFTWFLTLLAYAAITVATFGAVLMLGRRPGGTRADLRRPRIPDPRRAWREGMVQSSIKLAGRAHDREDRERWRDELIDEATKAYRLGLADPAIDALVHAHHLDVESGGWDTVRGTTHEFAFRMAETVDKAFGGVPEQTVWDLLEAAAVRDQVRGRPALAAYCTHLCLIRRKAGDLEGAAQPGQRAIRLYTDLLFTDLGRFGPFLAIAIADLGEVFAVGGFAEGMIQQLGYAVDTLRQHGRPVDFRWWRTDLVEFQAALAGWLIRSGHNAEAVPVVEALLSDVDQHFTAHAEDLPPKLEARVSRLQQWTDQHAGRHHDGETG